jgi:hypothetical protein
MSSCVKTLQLIGIQKLSKLVDMAIGSITILTGLFRVIVIGAHHFLSGDAKTNMKSALNHLQILVRVLGKSYLPLTHIAHLLMT